jgi:hypothetical protein
VLRQHGRLAVAARDGEQTVLALVVVLVAQFQRAAAIVVAIPSWAVAVALGYCRLAWHDRSTWVPRSADQLPRLQAHIWRARRSGLTTYLWLAVFAALSGWIVARLG